MMMMSGIRVRKLISTLKKKKKSAGGEWFVKYSPKILASDQKAITIISPTRAK